MDIKSLHNTYQFWKLNTGHTYENDWERPVSWSEITQANDDDVDGGQSTETHRCQNSGVEP